jgi:hypothetical protein
MHSDLERFSCVIENLKIIFFSVLDPDPVGYGLSWSDKFGTGSGSVSESEAKKLTYVYIFYAEKYYEIIEKHTC